MMNDKKTKMAAGGMMKKGYAAGGAMPMGDPTTVNLHLLRMA
jgi:hypothetical protein